MDIQQSILVTGAASGLGKATAEFLASCGAKLILLDKKAGNKNIIACDVTKEDQVQSVLSRLKDIPRVCVNCAGMIYSKKALSMTSDAFSKVLEVNVTGSFLLMKLLAEKIQGLDPVNAEGERGVFINVSSVAAFEGQIGQAAYSASKGAIASMTLPLAREFAKNGIRVMTIAPGVMETPMMLEVREDIRAQLMSQVPFPKRLGKPLEFAHLVKHIIENAYLNGSVIRLDGGLRMS